MPTRTFRLQSPPHSTSAFRRKAVQKPLLFLFKLLRQTRTVTHPTSIMHKHSTYNPGGHRRRRSSPADTSIVRSLSYNVNGSLGITNWGTNNYHMNTDNGRQCNQQPRGASDLVRLTEIRSCNRFAPRVEFCIQSECTVLQSPTYEDAAPTAGTKLQGY